MQASSLDIRERLLDAADLVIDFATLGEYGIEPEPVRELRAAADRASPRALRTICTIGPARRSASPPSLSSDSNLGGPSRCERRPDKKSRPRGGP